MRETLLKSLDEHVIEDTFIEYGMLNRDHVHVYYERSSHRPTISFAFGSKEKGNRRVLRFQFVNLIEIRAMARKIEKFLGEESD